MNKKRVLIGVFIFLFIIVGFVLYQETYAKYKKKVMQEVDISLANWDIKLNNQSIAGNSTVSGNITPIFEENDYVAENVLAPGIKGYFDINIDSTNVDVSFSYLLKIEKNEEYPDIIPYGYIADPDNNNTILEIPEEGLYGEIAHNFGITKIRVYIMWDDSSSNAMDNATDTAIAINNSDITINATFNFTQINN